MVKKQSMQGFTLFELMLVLGLIAALTIAAFVIFPKVRVSGQVQSESTNLTTIAAGVKVLYSGNYENISDPQVISGNVYPVAMLDSGKTSAKSSFGQSVAVTEDVIGPAGDAENPARYFDIIYAGVPSEACIRLGTGVSRNFANVTVGGNSVFRALPTGQYQVDIQDVTAQCNSASLVTMVFVAE